MPRAAPKPCSKHPRVLVTPSNPCAQCLPLQQARERERREKRGPRVYDKASWKRIRHAHLANEPWCRHHKERGEYVAATDVDHIDGDCNNMHSDNLQSLCHECHSIKTAREDGGFGNAKAFKE